MASVGKGEIALTMQLVKTANMAQQSVADVAFLSFVGTFGPFLSRVAGFFQLHSFRVNFGESVYVSIKLAHRMKLWSGNSFFSRGVSRQLF